MILNPHSLFPSPLALIYSVGVLEEQRREPFSGSRGSRVDDCCALGGNADGAGDVFPLLADLRGFEGAREVV
ncbi:MAG TPA: hypothetical protein DEQ14_10975 [Treponema sp.]|nr:hypothetical protein [Treponema sp.]